MGDCVLRAKQITSHTDNAMMLLLKLAHTPLTAFLFVSRRKQAAQNGFGYIAFSSQVS